MFRHLLSSRAVATVAAASAMSVLASLGLATSASARPVTSSEVGASALAVRTGKPVVVESLTSSTSLVTAMPDGTMQLETSTLPVRARVAGDWAPLDLTLVVDGGAVAPRVAAVPVRFAAGGDELLASVRTPSGEWVDEFWPYGDLPDPVLSGATATYEEVLPDVDLKLTATATGMTEVFVVKSGNALQDVRVRELTLETSADDLAVRSEGGLVATADDGSVVRSNTPLWWDSSHAGSNSAGPGGVGIPRPVAHDVVEGAIRLDLDGLPRDVTFPLYVDPDWTGSWNAFWYIDQAYPNQSYLNGNQAGGLQRMGYITAAYSPDAKNHLSRAFWQMNVAGVAGKQILAAQFSVSLNGAFNCSTTQQYPANLWTVSPVTTGATWNQTGNVYVTAISSAAPACGTAAGFNATPAVASAAASSAGSLTLALRASSESNISAYKKWNQGASLTVSYNSIPGKPSSPTFTSPARACSTDASNPTAIDSSQPFTIQVSASDADAGQTLTTKFTVRTVAASGFQTTLTASPAAAGAVSVTVPSNTVPSTGDFKWSAITTDSGGASGAASDWCYLRSVTESPSVPTITKLSDPVAVGAPMTVRFDSQATDGVKLFAYWWVSGASTIPSQPPVLTAITPGQPLPACDTGSGSVRFACPASGTLSSPVLTAAPVDTVSTLWVASYNEAGRVSLASGVYSAAHLTVTVAGDETGVSLTSGHIWDTQALSTSAPTIPDLNTTSGSSGTDTRQDLAAGATLVDSDVWGIPLVVQQFNATSTPSMTQRGIIDPSASFTVSVMLRPSPTASNAPHVAISQMSMSGVPAFTLGTDASGAANFCINPGATSAPQACAASNAVLPADDWTLVTGIWDEANQNVRVLVGSSVTPAAVAWLNPGATVFTGHSACIGARCTGISDPVSDRWDGQVFRPSIFPGVASHEQLTQLWGGYAPNDDPPADESIGAVVTLTCAQLITPQEMYDYNPVLTTPFSGWQPDTGSAAERALLWNGIACRSVWESSGTPVDYSVARIADVGTMGSLLTAARAGSPVSGLGTEAYFTDAGNTIEIFDGAYWVVVTSPWGADPDLAALALVHLP